ncbi:uncharacterized protein ATNIH1004_005308 [Aspergillus tanneri]|uniref:Uncharacterized protein n=1 Tax=Aspergillus tanneri TaxID=1220188 RepID=A0A5M9N4B4_9EURO|nr:uncharacterized protein ATNIH1004_005308 [Aspergillus tanneri]KAA8649407.1 hypothetical protein ATNIH1004_005308 [Aspergillus tanneri]
MTSPFFSPPEPTSYNVVPYNISPRLSSASFVLNDGTHLMSSEVVPNTALWLDNGDARGSDIAQNLHGINYEHVTSSNLWPNLQTSNPYAERMPMLKADNNTLSDGELHDRTAVAPSHAAGKDAPTQANSPAKQF